MAWAKRPWAEPFCASFAPDRAPLAGPPRSVYRLAGAAARASINSIQPLVRVPADVPWSTGPCVHPHLPRTHRPSPAPPARRWGNRVNGRDAHHGRC
jgi:hypothetical protein